MASSGLQEIAAALRASSACLVTSHTSPDGDAVGSMLLLCHLLEATGKTCTCVNDDPVPAVYAWLPGASRIQQTENLKEDSAWDTAIIVDAGQLARIGNIAERVSSAARLIVLDHHCDPSPCGDLAYLDSHACAMGEILLELAELLDVPLTQEMAVCAYVSIATDTGGFRFQNTTAKAHLAAAKLLAVGIDAHDISSRVFDVVSIPKFELLRQVVNRTRRELGGRLAHAFLTPGDFVDAGAKTEDSDGLINLLRNIDGVDVAVLFRETEEASVKVSMRSRSPFDCAQFLARFGGGGHAGAAGATLAGSLAEVEQTVLSAAQTVIGANS